MFLVFLAASLVAGSWADITGSNPAAGSCICLAFTGVNVRDNPCGTVIGSADPPQCYTARGVKQSCVLSGVTYEFHSVNYGARVGWMAGNYLNMGTASQCGGGGSGTCGSVQRVSRAEWGARAPAYNIGALPGKPIGMAFVHHTVTAACTNQNDCAVQMRSIQNYHMNTNGYPDIAYNWLVGEDGRAYEGRGWDKLGAHTLGYNDNAVAVAVIGDFTNRAPNEAAQAAVRNVINCAVQQNVLRSNYELFGHRDANCTACPGNTFYPVLRTWPQYSFRTIPRYCKKNNKG